MSEPKHTPGPWSWFGNTDTGHVYLGTVDRGRIYVLGVHQPCEGGTPVGRPVLHVQPIEAKYGMRPHTEFVEYEVCPDAGPNRDDRRVYRADFRKINHPDLLLMAAAPELLDALKALVDAADAVEHLLPAGHGLRTLPARLAIAKAEGRRDCAADLPSEGGQP